MKINLFIILFAIIFISFGFNYSQIINNDFYYKRSDSTWSVTYGDSLRIDYICKGDTLFQKRTDLKGINDDGFDDSFDVISIFSKFFTCNINEPKIVIEWDSSYFSFPKNELIDTLKSRKNKDLPFFKGQNVIKVLDDDDEGRSNNEYDKTSMITSKKYNNTIDTVVFKSPYLLFGLIPMSKFDMFYKSEHVTSIIKEEYQTEFSGGNYYYLINDRSDTIAELDLMTWIR